MTKLIRAHLRSNLRGRTRLTLWLAQRLRSLQAVPIVINGNQTVYIDLRDHLNHLLLAGSPWSTPLTEPDEQLVMGEVLRPGDVIFDIGAHMGLHTVFLSAVAGRNGVVHAFEANPERMPTLTMTVGQLSNTILHPYGLADREQVACLFVPEDQSMASLRDWTTGHVGRVRQTSCTLRVLDDVVREGSVPVPDFVKCDVEGAELLVFRGARNTLDRPDAPIILYEANKFSAAAFGQPVSAGTDFLRGLISAAYSIFHVQPRGTLHLHETFRDDFDLYNLMAVPRSRVDRLRSMADRIVWR
jgi:FkbM family methyltransferase